MSLRTEGFANIHERTIQNVSPSHACHAITFVLGFDCFCLCCVAASAGCFKSCCHAQVKADEQAAKAAADYAQAQAEAQAELHRQLQQRLADAQAAAAAQEAEKERRRAQPVTLKGARLAFNAPKAPGKPASTPPAGL